LVEPICLKCADTTIKSGKCYFQAYGETGLVVKFKSCVAKELISLVV
jgi:hypothetical protein